MYYVYHLQSENNPDKYYVGFTTNVERRLVEHNIGKSIHTNKFRPWKIVSYTTFSAFALEFGLLFEKSEHFLAMTYATLSVLFSIIFFFAGLKIVRVFS